MLGLALKIRDPSWDLVNDSVRNQRDALETTLVEQWKASADNPVERTRIRSILGCIDAMRTILVQAHRIRKHHNTLLDTVQKIGSAVRRGMPVGPMALAGGIVRSDFDALLLQGRAALDRLTWMITNKYKQRTQSFKSLEKVLGNFQHRDPIAQELLSLVNTAGPGLASVYWAIQSGESLRTFVAHLGSLAERTGNAFPVVFLPQKRALVFDCELGGHPLFKTTEQTLPYLTFLLMNSVAVLAGVDRLPLEEYSLVWKPQTVPLFEYIVDEPDGSPKGPHALTVAFATQPGGFEFLTRNFRPEVFDRAIPLTMDSEGPFTIDGPF
jgi:hypothetical protein